MSDDKNQERMIDKIHSRSVQANRKHLYTDELANKIIEWVERGGTIYSLCHDNPNMPASSTVREWSNAKSPHCIPEFEQRMRAAEIEREIVIAEQMLKWTEPGFIDTTLDTGTNKGFMPNNAEVAKYEMCIRNRQWLLSRLNPAKYGQKSHKNFKLDGMTASDKLQTILKLVSDGELSVDAAGLIAGLVKQESEMSEIKVLADAVKSLSAVAEQLQSGIKNVNEVSDGEN